MGCSPRECVWRRPTPKPCRRSQAVVPGGGKHRMWECSRARTGRRHVRYETLENYCTERGVIMEVQVTKEASKTQLTAVKAHPTWVSREPSNRTFMGYPAYDYQVYLAEDYLPGGKYADKVPKAKQERIETAYHEMMSLLNIKF